MHHSKSADAGDRRAIDRATEQHGSVGTPHELMVHSDENNGDETMVIKVKEKQHRVKKSHHITGT